MINKKLLKAIIKVLVTGIALWFVFQLIDIKVFLLTIKETNVFYYILAFLSFNISKIVSSIRLQRFYRCIGLNLTQKFNLKLYYVGMFYNLFLPGSIGGDGYKVYLLKNESEHTVKDLISATLMDRISGVSILLSFSFLLLIGIIPSLLPGYILMCSLGAIIGSFVVIGIYYIFLNLLLPAFLDGFIYTTWLSLIVQVGQLITAYFLLLALNVDSHFWEYLFLFMLSSIAAVLPFTIGGVGSREFVFIFGYQFLATDKDISVAFTMMFFTVLALSALIGILFSFSIDKVSTEKSDVNSEVPGLSS